MATSEKRPLGVAVIGLGFMGRTHIRAYRAAIEQGMNAKLVGMFDIDPARLSGEAPDAGNIGDTSVVSRIFDPGDVFTSEHLHDALERDDIDVVSVCTPTDTHVEIASLALKAGKHVLVEKPVALDQASIERLATDAEASGKICMPAMCMRFWPEWVWLREQIGTKKFGELRVASFDRLGTMPTWGVHFYADVKRSGGALHDLHVHDTDFVCGVIGVPDAVTSIGDISHVTTMYHYDDRKLSVSARGSWLRGDSFGFRMRYLAEFEHGVADFDLSSEPTLRLCRAGSDTPETVPHAAESGYEGEIRAFLGCVENGTPPPVTLQDARNAAAVLDAERRSLASGGREEVVKP